MAGTNSHFLVRQHVRCRELGVDADRLRGRQRAPAGEGRQASKQGPFTRRE